MTSVVIVSLILDKNEESVYALKQIENVDLLQSHRTLRSDLPTYSMSEVGKHTSRYFMIPNDND